MAELRSRNRITLNIISICLFTAIISAIVSPSSFGDELSKVEEGIAECLCRTVWGDANWSSPRMQPVDAVKAFDAALQRMPTDAGRALIWELRADYFRVRGDRAESLAASKVIYEQFRQSTRHQNAVNETIEHLIALGQYDEALNVAASEIGKSSDSKRISQLTILAARAMRHLGDWEGATALIADQLSQRPEQRPDLMGALRGLAGDAAIAGDHARSKEILTEIFTRSTESERDVTLVSNLAVEHGLTGDYKQAIRFHEIVLDKLGGDPRRIAHEFSLALLLADHGDVDRSQELMKSVASSSASFDGADRLRSAAAATLLEMQKSKRHPESATLTSKPNHRLTLWIIVANVAVVLLLVGFYWRRRTFTQR